MIYKDSMRDATHQIRDGLVLEVIPDYVMERIGDEWIIRVKPGVTVDINALAASLNAQVIGHIPEIHAWRLKFESEADADLARTQLEANSSLAGIDSNWKISRPDASENTSRIVRKSVNIRSVPGPTDKTVVVGLIDSAVAGVSPDSPYFDFLMPSLSVSGDGTQQNIPESITHGTAMFQTIMQGLEMSMASHDSPLDVKILPVDVYGGAPETNTFLVASATAQAIESGADIINLSLGGDQPSSVLKDLIEYGSSQGVVFIAAAGNEPVTTPIFPAAYPDVLAVSSVTSDGHFASFANRGSFVDVAAPPSAVVQYQGNSYITSGTSVSTAYISGVTAATSVLSNISPKQAEQSIRQNFKP